MDDKRHPMPGITMVFGGRQCWVAMKPFFKRLALAALGITLEIIPIIKDEQGAAHQIICYEIQNLD